MRQNSSITKKRPAANDIAVAVQVIGQQQAGLAALKKCVDTSFVKACDIIQQCKGRLVLSGMGKSGHIARKIAATFASTGTPALFVHPGEASHGDLGMIARDDVLLLLSNSGETAELNDVIAYAKRYSIKLIAIVRRKQSSLAEAADVAFVLPEIEESSPVNAPTTSTTMMLAWGDALAVAVMVRKGFTKEHFKVFHPGGKLGHGLMKVQDIMHDKQELPLVSVQQKMSDVVLEISGKRFGCAGVTDAAGKLVGVITDGDLRRHMGADLLKMKAGDIMTRKPKVIGPDAFAAEAVALMNEKAITTLFAVQAGKPVGIVHIHDLLRVGLG